MGDLVTRSRRRAGRYRNAARRLGVVSAIDPTGEPVGLTVLPPEEALRRAKPTPAERELVIDGLTDAESLAFEKALAER